MLATAGDWLFEGFNEAAAVWAAEGRVAVICGASWNGFNEAAAVWAAEA